MQACAIKLTPDIIDSEKHPTIYLSFSLRSLNESTRDKFAGVILYKDDKEVFGAGNDFGSDHFSFWDSNSTPTALVILRAVIDSDVHKIVIRLILMIMARKRSRLDSIRFVDEPKHASRTISGRRIKQELDFDEIRIRCGASDCAWEFSDLRIGTNWESVTPSDDQPGALVEAMKADSQSISAKRK